MSQGEPGKDEPSKAESEPRIIVDEDWKSRVESEREQLKQKESASAASSAPPPAPRQEPPASRSEPAMPHAYTLPPASFMTLVEMLAMQVMASLEDAMRPPEPGSDEPRQDPQFHLQMAKHIIDTLGVLEAKTKGNLTSEETQHLEHVLQDLRMAFLHAKRR